MSMMGRKLPAALLKKDYAVFGRFYRIADYKCRDVLEIISTASVEHKDILALDRDVVDAVFVMMNPGGSRPVQRIDDRTDLDHAKIVPACPDITQYQVMRVMHHFQWQHVRVLNLSDIRAAQSPAFFQKIKDFGDQHGEQHSIFHPHRARELHNKLLIKNNFPLLCGWGLSRELTGLITLFKRQNKNPYMGVQHPLHPVAHFFMHPSPMLQSQKELWLEAIINKIAVCVEGRQLCG